MSCGLKIAVADDEPLMLAYYRRILTGLGHEVVVLAGDGQELVDACLRQPPDLVISDIRMPVLDGVSATRSIVEQCDADVIFVSAFAGSAGLEQASGVSWTILEKPIEEADLAEAIAEVQRRRAFRRGGGRRED